MSTESPSAAVLKRILDERKMTPHGLSLAAGLRRDAVRSILVGRSKRPQADTLGALAAALGIELDVLAGRAPYRPQRFAPVTEILEYDLSPMPDGDPDPRVGRDPVAAWSVPLQAIGGRLAEILLAAVPGPNVGNVGLRVLVDMSPRGRVASPAGSAFLVWDGAGHTVAELSAVIPALGHKWKLPGGEEVRSLRIVGRVLARWMAG